MRPYSGGFGLLSYKEMRQKRLPAGKAAALSRRLVLRSAGGKSWPFAHYIKEVFYYAQVTR